MSFTSGVSLAGLLLFEFILYSSSFTAQNGHISALGDPGMRSKRSRVLLEGWNFCNGAQVISSGQPSPRWADCVDQFCKPGTSVCVTSSTVSRADNSLRTGDTFPNKSFKSYSDSNLYAVEKEKYLASLCQVSDPTKRRPTWYYWTSMLKNGNFDLNSGLCPPTSTTSSLRTAATRPFKLQSVDSFPCFGLGCMNQPVVVHEQSSLQTDGKARFPSLKGGFYGSYDLNVTVSDKPMPGLSFFSLSWEKNVTTGSWLFKHKLQVSKKYPWLMLYLRADATSGVSGGYPWDTRGMMTQVPVSPRFKVVLTLNVTQGGGPQSQFYLIDIGGCWKNNGQACNGDVDSDVTRYSEMIINPDITSWCTPSRLDLCPPFHVTSTGKVIPRNDTANFPYTAYHLYCSPTNAALPVQPHSVCDPYSNPQPQELMQLLPHPEWGVHGFPTKKGEGWVGDARTWSLDVGALSSRLYFYQDPGTSPAVRVWPSIDVGTEIYVSDAEQLAEWTVSDFDVLVEPGKV